MTLTHCSKVNSKELASNSDTLITVIQGGNDVRSVADHCSNPLVCVEYSIGAIPLTRDILSDNSGLVASII